MNQFFGPLSEPVGAVWCLMFLSVLWLLCRRQWRNAMWLGFPTVLLFVIGSTSVAEKLVAAEEKPWVGGRSTEQGAGSSAPNAPADAVVALGGGQRVSNYDALGFAMEDGGGRLLTAIELVRSGKAKTLVLGGSWPMPGKPKEPSMSVVQDWVTSWRLVEGPVTNLGICINTHDEAVAFQKLAQRSAWVNVMLVTSALHLRRSAAAFKQQGIAVTPVAADFHVQGVSQDLPFSPFPRQHRLFLLAFYLHEKIGWWAYRLRGWVT